MSEKYAPKRGDRVRVVLEGIATSDSDDGEACFEIARENYITPSAPHVVSIELLGPPIETFGNGIVLRHKKAPETVITIARGGYINHATGMWHSAPGVAHTSEHWERVVIS